MKTCKHIDEPTAEAFDDPRPGDIFQEMYSCWLRVLDVLVSERTNTKVIIWSWNGKGQSQGTVEEFQSQAMRRDIAGVNVNS